MTFTMDSGPIIIQGTTGSTFFYNPGTSGNTTTDSNPILQLNDKISGCRLQVNFSYL